MTFPRLKRHDIIEVVWLDAWSPNVKSWVTEHENFALEIKTVGIFWEQDKEYIYTYGSCSTNKEFLSMLNNPLFIPKGCIKSIKVLRLPR